VNEHPEELLPWYANGTLAPEEHERVERHLARCARCREELEVLRAMRREIKTLDAAPAPGDVVRARVLRAAPGARRPAWMPVALAASVAVIALQAALLVSLWRPAEPRYAPLGASPARVTLQVRFAPDATEREMRALLRAVNGTIVDGPGALGVYRIRLEGVEPDERERVRAAIATLRAAAPVTHVEREP